MAPGSSVNPTQHCPHIRVTVVHLCPSLFQKPNPRNLVLMETSPLGSTEPGGCWPNRREGSTGAGRRGNMGEAGAPWGIRVLGDECQERKGSYTHRSTLSFCPDAIVPHSAFPSYKCESFKNRGLAFSQFSSGSALVLLTNTFFNTCVFSTGRKE